MDKRVHQTKHTFPLSHFRQHTTDHLKRIAEGAVEVITQNGEAALVVMSPERYDALTHEVERGRMWRQAIARIGTDEGQDARSAIHGVAEELGVAL